MTDPEVQAEAAIIGVDEPHQCPLPMEAELWSVAVCPEDGWRWRLEPRDASVPVWTRYYGPVGAPPTPVP